MTTKKKNATPTPVAAKNNAVNLPPVGGADALPATGAPTPPANENPVAVDPRKGVRVLKTEVGLAENAVAELRSSNIFSEVLAPRLGTAAQIADALDFGVRWYREAEAALTWRHYTQTQSNLAWIFALALIDRLRGSFQIVEAADPGIASELPNFTKLLGARQAVAAKANITKRKIKSGEIVVNKADKPPRKGTKKSTAASAAAAKAAPAMAAEAPAAAGPVVAGGGGGSH